MWRYDNLHRTETIDDGYYGAGTGGVTRYGYDRYGRQNSVTDQMNVTTSWTLDALGRKTTQTDGLGKTWSWSYDAVGNVTGETDPLADQTRYEYDRLSRKVRQYEPGATAATAWAYDPQGNLASLTDPAGNTTSWAYDQLGWTTSETSPLGTRTFYYNNAGRMYRMVDALGRNHRWNTDRLGRVTKEYWRPNANTTVRSIDYYYDPLGRLDLVTDTDNESSTVLSTIDYSYDLLDRATGIVQTVAGLAPAVTLDQQFDEAGNRTVLAATIGTTADFSNDYFYDFLNRLKRVRQKGVAGGNVVAQKRVEYDYNPDHSVRKVERFRDLAGTKLVATTAVEYDDAGRLESLAHTKGTTTLAAYGWTYYDDGQVNTFSSADGVLTYGYDAADQLTSVTRSGVGLESYAYDDAGNREMAGYVTGTANQLASDGTYDYEYDDEGNREQKLLAGTSTLVEEYTWDYRNRLTKVTFYSGGAVTKTVDYSYDAFNHLIARKVTSGGTTDQRYFVYDGDQMVLVLDPTGAVTNRYLWGAAVDEILADEQVGGELLWTLTDNLGTVRELVNNTSTVRNHIVYDTYGNVLSETAGSARSSLKFTGRYLDTETGLQWNLNRWYDPKVGRWLSQDPIGFESGDANLYRYVGNDPGNGVDPSGLADSRREQERLERVAAELEAKGLQKEAAGVRDRIELEKANRFEGWSLGLPGRGDFQVLAPKEWSREVIRQEQEMRAERERVARATAEFVVGCFVEPYDWLLTARDIFNEPKNPWSYAGLLPMVPSGAGRLGKNLTEEVSQALNDAARCAGQTPTSTGASNVNAAEALRAKLSGLQKAQKTAASTRSLPDGRIRYYGGEVPASKPGPTRGASFVTEWDPRTGNVRQWMESYDHAGKVVRVHPKTINGQQVIGPHYPPTGKELGR